MWPRKNKGNQQPALGRSAPTRKKKSTALHSALCAGPGAPPYKKKEDENAREEITN